MKIIFTVIAFFLTVLGACGQQEQVFNDGFTRYAENVGGLSEFKRFVQQELVYPKSELNSKVKGKVKFKFIVLKDSSITSLEKVDSVSDAIDKEALKLFRKLEWVPAIYKDELASTVTSVTFNFNPRTYKRWVQERGYDSLVYFEGHKVDTSVSVCEVPDQPAQYINGEMALPNFLKENLVYPKQAQLVGLQGQVEVGFIVETTGLPTNIKVLKTLGAGCDEEATRVVSLIKWYPAIKNEDFVRSRQSLKITFGMENTFRDNSLGEQ